MKEFFLLAVIAVLCLGCNDRSVQHAEENAVTEKEIRDFVNDYDRMWAKRDTTAMKEAMAENYIYFTSVGTTSTRDRIISWFTPADKYKVDTAIRSEINVVIHGNNAVVSSRWIGSGSFDGERFRDDQRCGFVIKKENGKLSIISEHCVQIEKKQ
jgi:ketosteroid isomerase-like protein